MSSVAVAVQGRSTTTGADGRYSITGLSDGAASLTAQHQGHRNFTQAVTLSGGTTANFAMTPAIEAGSAGNWSGRWTNTTFGSTAAVTMTLTVDTVAQTFRGTVDFAGTVFGVSDPAPQTFSGPYNTTSGASFSGTSSFFGAVTGTVSTSGEIAGTMTNPTSNISRVDYAGTATTSAISITYTVRFTNGSTATGTVTLTK